MVLAGLPFYLPVSPVSAQSRDAGEDFALAPENNYPTGLWSDGTTMWVADFDDSRLYAYSVSDQSRDPGKDFRLAAENDLPIGIWSDGVTMWVSDWHEAKAFAYNLSTKAWDSDRDFDTLKAAGNNHPEDLWSDGVTMWVGDTIDDKLYAYNLSDKTRDPDKDFDTLKAAGNNQPVGIWSDGVTMWVSDWRDAKVFAYSMSTKARDASKDFTLDTDNSHSEGIWSDGITMWVADREDDKPEGDKLYAYTMPPGVTVYPTSLTMAEGGSGTYTMALNAAPTADVTVDITAGGDVSVSPTSVTFSSSNWSTAQTVTVSAAHDDDAANDTATLQHSTRTTDSDYSGVSVASVAVTVADDESAGVTVSVPTLMVAEGGSGTYTMVLDAAPTADVTVDITAGGDVSVSPTSVRFSSSNWSTAQIVTVSAAHDDDETHDNQTVSHSIGNGSASEYAALSSPAGVEVSVGDDDARVTHFELAADNGNPAGIWSDGNTMWVTDDADRKLYAYNMSTKARDTAKDFDALDAGNVLAAGIWSDGATMWVAERSLAKLYAYRMSDGGRDAAKDFDTLRAAGNAAPRGIWSDGTTMWVADTSDDKAYAYNVASKARDTAKDFDTLDAANTSPQGIWSDGTTMWVADASSDKLYAYSMASKARDTAKDFDTLDAANTAPQGIWSDGTTMWVADASSDKLYAYDMPASVSAALRTPSRLVANTDQPRGPEVGIHSSNPKIGQGFTTGAWANGYALTSVAVRFGIIGADTDLTTELSATINEPDETDESSPGDALCTLIGPPSYAAFSLNTYTAPASGCQLSPNTAYFVVLEREYEQVPGAANLVTLVSTAAATESSGSAAGWSIADYHNYWTHDMWRTETERKVKIELVGYPGKIPAATDIGATELTEETAVDEPFWSATLTVGGVESAAGFDLFTGLGSLSSRSFWIDGRNFGNIVGSIYVYEDNYLYFVVNNPRPTEFTLSIDGFHFSSRDAEVTETDILNRYRWAAGELSLSVGDEVNVSLVLSDSTDAEPELGTARSSQAIDSPGTVNSPISGTPQEDESTTADTPKIADEVNAGSETPLTVGLENAATTHDGSAAFTFELRFSENLRLSYVTLRDRAFVVTDGDVLRAQRIDKPSNILWRITVHPDGNGDVTVVLPVTTDCDADGAICTHDGRKLSNQLELTVSGPS